MKKLLRSDAVQEFLGWLSWLYLQLVISTIRWTRVGEEPGGALDQVLAGPGGMIGCFWHGDIALSITAKVAVIKRKVTRILISLSPDGEFIARSMVRHNMPPIRGSSAKKGKAKGGAAAFRQALRFMRDGGLIAITPDGPRGPNQVMPEGTVIMAQAAKVPVVLFGLAAEPAIQFKSWDEARIPLPFGRGCVVFDGPLFPPETTDEASREATRADWQARLIAAQKKAEAILAGAKA